MPSGVTRPQGAGFDIGAVEAILSTTWNPSDKGTAITLSNGNLTFANTVVGAAPVFNGVRSIASATSGKKYWELTARQWPARLAPLEGVANGSFPANGGGVYLGNTLDGVGWAGTGKFYIQLVVVTIQGWQQGDILSFALDLDNKKIWFRTNGGNWNDNQRTIRAPILVALISPRLTAGPYFAFGQGVYSGDTLTANFGETAYAESVPSRLQQLVAMLENI